MVTNDSWFNVLLLNNTLKSVFVFVLQRVWNFYLLISGQTHSKFIIIQSRYYLKIMSLHQISPSVAENIPLHHDQWQCNGIVGNKCSIMLKFSKANFWVEESKFPTAHIWLFYTFLSKLQFQYFADLFIILCLSVCCTSD